jgi:hypothetical protein
MENGSYYGMSGFELKSKAFSEIVHLMREYDSSIPDKFQIHSPFASYDGTRDHIDFWNGRRLFPTGHSRMIEEIANLVMSDGAGA